jgi:putative hydrolase of the HAD superfamily
VNIRAITLDFWGTLLYDGPASDNRYKARRLADFGSILGTAGLPVSPGALDRAYEASAGWLGRIWAGARDVPVEEHVLAILRGVDPDLPARVSRALVGALVEAYARPVLVVPPALDDGAPAALAALVERGYTLAVVSNTMRTPGATLRKLLQQFRVLDRFRHLTFSDEVGVRKPDPAIFALTLEAVEAEPAAAVHVGDDAVLDVQGARAAGMRVIQVTASSLRALGAQRPDAVIPSLARLPEAITALESTSS